MTEKGGRKFYLQVISLSYLLVGLVASAMLKADNNLYFAFVAGVAGVSGFTMNAFKKEYEMTATAGKDLDLTRQDVQVKG